MRSDHCITTTATLPPSSFGPGAAICVVLLAVPALLLFASGELTLGSEYDRARIAGGEWWRILTCHWTHWSGNHLLWDLAVFLVLLAATLARGAGRALATLAVATLAIPAAVWLWIPEMTTYRGLSGLDSALFVLLAVDLVREAKRSSPERWLLTALLGGFAAKLAFEALTGDTIFVDARGFVPVPLAHLVGGGCGLLAALGIRPLRTIRCRFSNGPR